MKKINFEKDLLIGCIPVDAHPEHPSDQSPCIQEKCPICQKNIWVSEKKRKLRQKNKYAIAYCLVCIVKEAIRQGRDPDSLLVMDIGQI